MNVSAKDKGTGKEQQIKIQASGGLSDSEIDTMVQDAESHAEEDKEKREGAESRNQADALVHSTEKNLNEHGDKIADEDKEKITEDLEALKSAISDDDNQKIKEKTETLAQSAMKLGEAMYKSTETGADNQSPSNSSASEGEEIVDADFEEVIADEDQSTKEN